MNIAPNRGNRLAAVPMAVVLLGLTACPAKRVEPVAMSQPGDDGLGCPQLREQRQANVVAAAEFLRQDKDVAAGNVAKTVAGGVLLPIGLPILLSTDLSNTEQVKARSLIDRDERLAQLMKSKGCENQ